MPTGPCVMPAAGPAGGLGEQAEGLQSDFSRPEAAGSPADPHTDRLMTGERRGPGVRLPGARAPRTDGPPARWAVRRLFPLLASAILVLAGMVTTTLIEPQLLGTTAWSLPDDLWGTLIAAQRLLHLNLGGLYTQPTGLITFPGAAVILTPIVAVSEAAGLSLSPQGPNNPQPALWLLAGPY